MREINLKFVNLGLHVYGFSETFRINPNFYHLKSYYQFRSKNYDKINWLPRTLCPNETVSEIVNTIVKESVDVLCISCFVWNQDRIMMIAEHVKQLLPNIKIVAGGPNLLAHKEENFFEVYPFIDYTVYGDGEQAFVEILDSIVENRTLADTTVNTVTKEKMYPFKIFDDAEYKTISPILSCKDDIIEDVESLRGKGYRIHFHWERARGCPYTCSFCDWSSGLHHKVKRSESKWKDELDFLFSLELDVTPSDANWGIYKEDLEITKYAVEHGFFYITNLAKLQKERAFEITRIIYKAHEKNNLHHTIKFSIQDINEDVLQNINRPDVPWEQHKKYILDFKEEFPNAITVAEFIVGLPGQTKQSLLDQFYEIEKAKFNVSWNHLWDILPNAPAYNSEYQKHFDINYKMFRVITQTFESTKSIFQAIEQGKAGWKNSAFVIGHSTLSFEDIISIKLLGQIYTTFKRVDTSITFASIHNLLLDKIEQESKRIVQEVERNQIFGVYDTDTGSWYDIELYFLVEERLEKFLNKHKMSIKDFIKKEKYCLTITK